MRAFFNGQRREFEAALRSAATPLTPPRPLAAKQREHPRRQGTQPAARTVARRPHGRRAGVRAPAAVGGVQGGALSLSGAGPPEL